MQFKGIVLMVICGLSAADPLWSTGHNTLLMNGEPVTLKGFGTTCTEYLLRGIGMKCFATYTWNDPSTIIINPNTMVTDGILGYFATMKNKSVVPAVRIPLTASYWLDVESPAWADNRAKYPELANQYQSLIHNLVKLYTDAGAVAILDLHWNDDVDEQQQMALKKPADGAKSNATGSAIDFWDSVADQFGENKLVWYELYNEPHVADYDAWAMGTDTFAGMIEMYNVVRKHTSDSMIVIAGQKDYAYDSASFIKLDGEQKLTNVVYNWHPYMGQNQAGDVKKSAQGFHDLIKQVRDAGVTKPLIITEFGQGCCAQDGECFDYPGTWNGNPMGYVEAIIQIASSFDISFIPWSWRPSAGTSNCEAGKKSGNDMNGEAGNSTVLTQNTGDKGANFAKLFTKYWI